MSEIRAATIEVSTVSVGAVVDRALRLIELDAAFAALVDATTPENLLGRPISDLFPHLEVPLREVLTSEQMLFAVPIQVHSNGHAPLDLAPLRSSRGTIVGVELTISSSAHALAGAVLLEVEREQLLEREQAARAQADEALALLDTLLDTAPIGLCFLSPDYRYLRINETLARLNGMPAAQHLGRSVREVLPDLASTLEPIFAQVLATGVPIVDREIVEEHAPTTGARRIWRTSYYPVSLPDGRLAGLGVIANEITAYREASEGLRLSAERFRVALKNSPILVYTTNNELRYTWMYNAYPSFDQIQVLGHRDEELLPPEEAVKLTALKRRVIERAQGERHEVQLNIADEPIVYDMTIEPLRDTGGAVSGLTVAAIDITERRRAEAALRESEARYSALAEAMPAILFANRPDGTNEYLSQNYYDYTGTQRGSGSGYAWTEQLHPDDRERTLEAWQAAVYAGAPLEIEYRLRHHSGAYRWFRVKVRPIRDAVGAITRWFGVCLDIEDQKQASVERELLLASELAARTAAERSAARIAQLQEVTAALSEALTPAQVAEVIVYRSMAALGATMGSLRLVSPDGQSLDLLSSASLPEAVAEQWGHIPLDAPLPVCAVARTGRPLYFADRTALAADYPHLEAMVASPRYQAFAIVPLNLEGRTLGALVLTFSEAQRFAEEDRDVLLAMTSQAAQALERARLYAAARDAVEVRDNFITIASHDLRSPLAALLGQAQLIERRAEHYTPEQIRQRSHVIVEQTQRINRMIGTLLDLSRIQSGQLAIEVAPLDLAALAARVVTEIRPTLHRHHLELLGEPVGLQIAGDELRLEHVLYNLIGNAVKYSPHGGPVTIRIERQGAQACIAVADQGIGVPSEALPRLFERYYRAANAGMSGMGIGLYAAREILSLHGGTITVESTEGVGSTFTINLPLA